MLTITEVLARAQQIEREGFDAAYEISPDALYEGMLQLIGSDTTPILDGPGAHNYGEYMRLLENVRRNETAIADALLPFGEIFEADPARRAARAQVLELARKWFTAELHARFDDGAYMALHIKVEREVCKACAGKGKLEAGSTGVMVDCPICHGAGKVRVSSRWRL